MGTTHICMFLTNVATFKEEINRLPNSVSFVAKKHYYNIKIIYWTQSALVSVIGFGFGATYVAIVPNSGKTMYILARQCQTTM